MRPYTETMGRLLLTLLVLAVYLLHQDVWLWGSARPLVFGFLPVGLAYHAGYMVLAAGLMAILVRYAWPEDEAGDSEDRRG